MTRLLNRFTISLLCLAAVTILIACNEGRIGMVSTSADHSTGEKNSRIPAPPEAERVVVRIIEYEQVRDLSTNPYADAYATAKVLPLESFGRTFLKKPCILKFRVLDDRKRLAAADFQPSDLIGVHMYPEDSVSDYLKSMQTLETVHEPELETFYAGRPTFLSRPHPHRAEKEELAKRISRPVPVFKSDPTTRLIRLDQNSGKQQRIAKALTRIEAHLQREGEGSWEAWQSSLQGFRSDLYATAKHESEINYQVRKAMEVKSYDAPVEGGIPAFDALKQLADQVEEAGMDFVLLSVPSRIETYPEWFSSDANIESKHVGPTRLHYLKELLEEGIEVVDAGDFFREAKLEHENQELFWKGQEFHVSPRGYEVLGAKIADLIDDRNVLTQDDYLPFASLAVDREMVAVHHDPGTMMRARRVMHRENRTPFRPNSDSPVFFLGDSTLYWWQTNMYGSCGLVSQLAQELNHVVDWKAQPNLQPHDARQVDPSRMKGKKLWIQVQTAWVIWSDDKPHRNVELTDELVSVLTTESPD